MFTAVKQAHPPTAVDFAVPCSLVPNGRRNLAVVKNTVLELYELRVQSDDTQPDQPISYARLELRHSTALFGKIAQVAAIRPSGSATDRLLLAFDYGNLSIVAWDPVRFDFSTVAIQSFADSSMLVGRGAAVMIPPMLRSDPQNRCAAMLVHGLHLHIVPIAAQYQRIHMDDKLTDEDGGAKENYVIDLEGMGITDIKDFQFLAGTLEPTVCILYGTPTWTGRLAEGRATMAVRTLSLSLQSREQTEIWSATELPYNSTLLSPVAPPFGGAMLVANNTIWYLNTTTRIAVAVNEFGLDDLQACRVTASLGGPHDLSDVAISLQACCVSFLDGTHALLNLSRGQMFCVELVTEVRSVVSFAINREAAGVLVSCTCKLSDQLVFLGSRLADSQLVEFKRHEQTDDEQTAVKQSATSIIQSMDMNQSVKEALNLILMELRVALDRASTKVAVGEAITRAEPKLVSFLAEHGTELPGLREVCKQLLISCGWDTEHDRWSGSVESEEPGAEEKDWAGKKAAIADLDEAVESLSVFKRRRVGKAATDFDDDLFGTMDMQNKRDVSGLPPGHSQIRSTKSFVYTPWDTLPNIGPISDFVVGKSHLSASGGGRLEEIVTCSGSSKNGALYVLHRDVRPQVHSTIPLPGCRAIWSVQHMKTQESWNLPKPEPEDDDEEEMEETVYHAFVLLSMEETDQTMVLKAGTDGLNTLDGDTGGFVIDEETVMAGNASKGRHIVQVCRSRVVLLDDSLSASEYVVESDSTDTSDVPPFICSAAISDPYILLYLSNSSSVLLKANASTGQLERVSVQFGEANITSVALFVDLSSTWLYSWGGRTALTGAAVQNDDASHGALTQGPGIVKAEKPVAAVESAATSGMDVELDDEEMDIFGDSEPSAKPEATGMLEDAAVDSTEASHGPDLPNRHFCVVSREGGVVEIFLIADEDSTPRLERVFLCDVPPVCSNLHDSRVGDASRRESAVGTTVDGTPGLARASSTGAASTSAEIREIHVHVLDEDLSRPVMACVLDTGNVLLHRAYSYDNTEGNIESDFVSGQKPIAFSAIEHDHLFAPTKREREALQAEGGDGDQVIATGTMMTSRVVAFDRVGGHGYEPGHSGFFIGGARPAWVLCEKECVRVHPMRTDGNIRSFSGLHIPPTEQAFVTLNSRSELKICKLHPDVQLGGPWPSRKIGLKATAHKVVYHDATGTYAVVTSTQMSAEKETKAPVTNADGVVEEPEEEEIDEGPKAKRLPRIAEKFEVRLMAPQRDWNCVDRYEFKADEHVLVIRSLKLTESKEDRRREKQVEMLGIGTGMCRGEDNSCEGRLILLAVEATLSGDQIVEQYIKEEKGPVCSMAQVQSEYVVATAGTGIDPNHRGATIIVHKFKMDDEGKGRLTPAAFYHNEVYAAHLTTIKGANIVLMGDPYKSVNCLAWRIKGKRIELLARDYQALEVDASTFVLDGSKRLNIICSDSKENLQIFTLPTEAAGLAASGKGKRLQVTGQFHLGTKVLQFALHHLEADDSGGSGVAHDPKKLAVIYAGLDGSIGTCCMPPSPRKTRWGRAWVAFMFATCFLLCAPSCRIRGPSR